MVYSMLHSFAMERGAIKHPERIHFWEDWGLLKQLLIRIEVPYRAATYYNGRGFELVAKKSYLL